MQSVHARLTQRCLARAYSHWSHHTAAAAKEKAQQWRLHTTHQVDQMARLKARLRTMAVQRMARLLVSHRTTHAFRAWQRTTNQDKHHATMVRWSSKYARVHVLTRRLHTWHRHVRWWRTVTGMMRRMKHAALHRRWRCWCRFATRQRARRVSLTTVLGR